MIPGMFANHTFFLQRGRGLAHFLARQRPVYVLERRRTGTFDEIVQHDVRSACEAVAAEEAASGGRMVLAGHSAGAGAALCAALSQVRQHRLELFLSSLFDSRRTCVLGCPVSPY
jgi:cephalosporin-C deacetylase-like acetyl esterase